MIFSIAMQRDYRSKGIILSKRRQGEADCFLEVFSPSLGKLTLIAKGAFKITSGFVGRLEIGQEAVFLVHVSGHGYHLITGLDMEESTPITIKNPADFFCLCRIVNFFRRIDFPSELNYTLYRLLQETIAARNRLEDALLLCYLKIRVLNLLGLLPDFRYCGDCGEKFDRQSAGHTLVGEIHCCLCGKEKIEHQEQLSFNQLKILNFFTFSALSLVEKLSVEESDRSRLENYANLILEHGLNLRPEPATVWSYPYFSK